MTELKRPIMRYHGGKWRIAPWIISHFPKHRTYVEPFGGGGSVLLRKAPCYAEVYNDLNAEIVNVFRVLRDESKTSRLKKLITLTPFAREEFKLSYEPADCDVEQARRTLFRACAGFGSAVGRKGHTGFRGNVTRAGQIPAEDWKQYPDLLNQFTERLRGVVIENRPALQVIEHYDYPDALHYVDPPYVLNTRNAVGAYGEHEMSDEDHRKLAGVLRSVCGFVVLSGYDSPLYDKLYPDWLKVEKNTIKSSNKSSVSATEVLYLNPKARDSQKQQNLFFA